MFGLDNLGALTVWLTIVGLTVLALLGSLLLFLDDKKMWGFSYVGIAVVAVIIGLKVHASSVSIAESFKSFSP